MHAVGLSRKQRLLDRKIEAHQSSLCYHPLRTKKEDFCLKVGVVCGQKREFVRQGSVS
jgi:hypothetical protein